VFRPFLQAKIYPLRVSAKSLEYEGSLGLAAELIERAGLAPGQRVLVVNLANGARFDTYLIESPQGACELNGGTARLGEIGDSLIVMAFAYLEQGETIKPRIVKVGDGNRPVEST